MPYVDLVLEGGGVKGIGLVGALSVLEERGYEVKRVAGTSAGAIVGALVAAGLSAAELEKIMRSVDYAAFQDGHALDRLLVGKAFGLLVRHGIYRGDFLRSWLAQQLDAVGVKTFADLPYQDQKQSLPPEKQFRLVVMTSDLSQGQLRRLPWHYDRYGKNPGAELVVDAVRASMSIPFFYAPVRWDSPRGGKSWLVDGGMLSNFPIDVFDAPEGQRPRWPTIGIKLSARPEAAQGETNKIAGTLSMSVAMIKTLTGFYDRMHIENSDAVDRTIFVDTNGIKATDFNLSSAAQDTLYQNGRQAASNFLDGTDKQPKWDFDTYIAKHRAE